MHWPRSLPCRVRWQRSFRGSSCRHLRDICVLGVNSSGRPYVQPLTSNHPSRINSQPYAIRGVHCESTPWSPRFTVPGELGAHPIPLTRSGQRKYVYLLLKLKQKIPATIFCCDTPSPLSQVQTSAACRRPSFWWLVRGPPSPSPPSPSLGLIIGGTAPCRCCAQRAVAWTLN